MDNDDDNNDYQVANLVKVNLAMEKEEFTLKVGGYYRAAYFDQSRNFGNLDETYIKYANDNTTIILGNQVYNWTIMEVFGLGDFYNARNQASSSGDTERIGLPSLNFRYEFEESFIQLISIFNTPPSHFAQGNNRLGIQFDLEDPKFLSANNETGDPNFTQYILRFKKYFDNFELDMHYARKFDSAFPIIVIEKPVSFSGNFEDLDIRPYYQPIKQTYLSVQGEYWESLWKFEYLNVDFDGHEVEFFLPPAALSQVSQIDFQKVSLGFERAHDYENNHSATFLVEYTTVVGVTYEEARTLGAFQRDLMLGYRHNFNDFKSHEVQFAAIIDVQEMDENLYTFKHSMRANNDWTIETTLTVIDTAKPDSDNLAESYYGLKPVRESDNILFNIIRFF